MRYGIISDIHSNQEALNASLAQLKYVDKILCLGDIVGYSASPNQCTEKVRHFGCKAIAGNHDLAATEKQGLDNFNLYAKRSILWTKENLTEENKEYLRQLPNILIIDEMTLLHGSLTNLTGDYITNTQQARDCFSLLSTQICFIGHTHIPEYYIQENNKIMCQNIKPQDRSEIIISDNLRYIINCGSVGQPRDRDPRASFGIYDSKKKKVEIIRVDYLREITKRKMEEVGLPRILQDRLDIGW